MNSAIHDFKHYYSCYSTPSKQQRHLPILSHTHPYTSLNRPTMNSSQSKSVSISHSMMATMDRINIILVGDTGVGKTTILKSFTDLDLGTFLKSDSAHVSKMVKLNDKDIRVNLWDTGGQERYRSLTASYFRKAHGVLLTFDNANPESFHHLPMWLDDIKKYCPDDDVSILLIGFPHHKRVKTVKSHSNNGNPNNNSTATSSTTTEDYHQVNSINSDEKFCSDLTTIISYNPQNKNNISSNNDNNSNRPSIIRKQYKSLNSDATDTDNGSPSIERKLNRNSSSNSDSNNSNNSPRISRRRNASLTIDANSSPSTIIKQSKSASIKSTITTNDSKNGNVLDVRVTSDGDSIRRKWISSDQAQKFASNHDMDYFEVKDNDLDSSLTSIFHFLLEQIRLKASSSLNSSGAPTIKPQHLTAEEESCLTRCCRC